jgi:hypothetical protein
MNDRDSFKFTIFILGGPCDHWLRAPQFLTTRLRGCSLRNFIPTSEPSLSVIFQVTGIQKSLNIYGTWVTKFEFLRSSKTGALIPKVAVNVGVTFSAVIFLVISLNRICFANCVDSGTTNTPYR